MFKKIFDKYRSKVTGNNRNDYESFDFQNEDLYQLPSESNELSDGILASHDLPETKEHDENSFNLNNENFDSDNFFNKTEDQDEKLVSASEINQQSTGDVKVNSQETDNVIDRSDRFVNRNKPGNHDARSYLNNESKVVKFINQEHYNFGFHTGFNYGSLDAKNTAVDQIIGEFQLLINEAIQLQLEKRAIIQHHLLSIKELPNSVEHAQFEHAVLESTRRIDDLKNEINMSAKQEGIIKKAISQYETGYMKGYREYLDNSDLLCN